MAAVVKFCSRNYINRIFFNRYHHICSRSVSTTKHDDKESACVTTESKNQYEFVPDFSKPQDNKNWVSYGLSFEDEKLDTLRAHTITFLLVSVIVCFGGLFFAYMPDAGHREWAKREAFIRLHEREILGLEPIDPNYVDPSKINLPSDEELGDTEIII